MTFFAVWLLLGLIGGVEGHTFTLKVAGDRRRVMDLGVFGFGGKGIISLDVKSISLDDKEAEKTGKKVGFTLDRVSTAHFARQEKNYGKGEGAKNGRCFIDDDQVMPLAPAGAPESTWRHTFPLETLLRETTPAKRTFPKREVHVPGLYALFFYNCKRFNNETSDGTTITPVPVNFEVKVTFMNVMPGGQRTYLSWGKRFLPEMYACFTTGFLILFGLWARWLVITKKNVYRIHHLMTALLVFKILSLFCIAMKEYWNRHTGHISTWSYLFYIFLTIKGIMLFVVILLIGTGWSFLKPFLSEKDMKIITAIVPLQIVIHTAIAVIEESSEAASTYNHWRDMLMISDVVCCCVVLLPIIWSIKNISESQSKAHDGKEELTLERLRQFRTFYAIVVFFIYFTRIVVPFIETALPFRKTWIAPFLAESASLSLYFFAGWRFGPAPMIQKQDIERPADDGVPLVAHSTEQRTTTTSSLNV